AGHNVDASATCGGGRFVSTGGAGTAFEFDVKSPDEGFWNSGVTVTLTGPNAASVGANSANAMQLQYNDEGQWQTIAYHFRQGCSPVGCSNNPGGAGADVYVPAGQVVTANEPKPGTYRVFFSNSASLPGRIKVDFHTAPAEPVPLQEKIDASSMDFFDDLNRYIPDGSDTEPIQVADVIARPERLASFDSIVVVNKLGSRAYVTSDLGLSAAEANAYFAGLKRFAQEGGNLVLTDAALQALPELGIVPASTVAMLTDATTQSGNYAFEIASGNVTYRNPSRYPLTAGVNKPGAAEQELGRRQAVEPVPLGYTPETGLDGTPRIPFWRVERTAWQNACGQPDCAAAVTHSRGTNVNLGEARLGAGRVRIAGIMFPDPVFEPQPLVNDHRFGLASYALTYTGWQVFENLIDYRRP
ncbi:MAG TPA: hypothetical protein VM638_04340, partial [Actinomycetota bacterium]|nr:hypothetical protein [Actinomycetota bacterium]